MDPGLWTPLVATVLLAVLAVAAVAYRSGRRLAAQRRAIVSLARALGGEGTARGHVCDAAARIADAAFACLAEPTSDGLGLVVTATADVDLAGAFLPFDSGPTATIAAYRSGRPIHVADVRQARELPARLLEGTGACAARFEPVVRGDQVVGVLVLGWRQRHDDLPADAGDMVRLLAREAARAMEEDMRVDALVRQARTDPLTGLPNRRAWDEMLDRELARADRAGSPVCVALLDLDRFKAYNDEHGHPAGDELLRRAARAWRRELRAQDGLARYGGEEFALLLPDTPLEVAHAVVERVRLATPDGQGASAGVVQAGNGERADSVVARADAALYRAKAAGRGQTVFA